MEFWAPPYDKWLSDIEAFVGLEISADEFEAAVYRLNATDDGIDRDNHAPCVITGQVFNDVEDFCGEPELWEPGDLDEETLRVRMGFARDALRVIRAYAKAR